MNSREGWKRAERERVLTSDSEDHGIQPEDDPGQKQCSGIVPQGKGFLKNVKIRDKLHRENNE